MLGQIILGLGLIIIVFYNRNKMSPIEESWKKWFIFFLIFLGIITAYSIDLITHFSYSRFLLLLLSFILLSVNFYKRFKKIRVK